jgi:Domain of unknown function (DUF6438)
VNSKSRVTAPLRPVTPLAVAPVGPARSAAAQNVISGRLSAGLRLTLLLAAGTFASHPITASDLPAQPVPSVDVVTMHRSACHGTCPVYEVEIRKDGTVRWKGEQFVAATGSRWGRVTPQELNAVVAAVERADFFQLQDRYKFTSDGCKYFETDNPSVAIVVTRAGTTKHVEYYYGCSGLDAAERIEVLAKAIDTAAHTARWIKHE